MGCCTSRPSSARPSPYGATTPNNVPTSQPAHLDSSSRANINTSAANPVATSTPQSQSLLSIAHPPSADHRPRRSSSTNSRHRHRDRRRSHLPHAVEQHQHDLSTAPNKPLRLPSPSRLALPEQPTLPSGLSHSVHSVRSARSGATTTTVTWTRSQLQRERAAFFDTRVTGSAEVWGVIRMICELLQKGDVPGAQTVLDVSGCTCPTGDVSDGVFDERGAFYQVPGWVVGQPAGVVEDEVEEVEGKEFDGEEEGEVERRRDEKGKGRAVEVDPGEEVRVRCRLSDRGTDVVVRAGKEQHVKVLIRLAKEAAGIDTKTKVKIAYLGKVLPENESLTDQGWKEGHVVNALVFGP